MIKLAKNDKANNLLPKFIKLNEALEKVDLVCTKADGSKYDFNRFSLPLKFIEKIHNYEITLDEAINNQTELGILVNKLNSNYNPRNLNKIEEKKRVLESAKKLWNAKKDIISSFENGIFPYKGNVFKTKEEEEEEGETITDANVFNEQINKEEKNINN